MTIPCVCCGSPSRHCGASLGFPGRICPTCRGRERRKLVAEKEGKLYTPRARTGPQPLKEKIRSAQVLDRSKHAAQPDPTPAELAERIQVERARIDAASGVDASNARLSDWKMAHAARAAAERRLVRLHFSGATL